MTDRPTALVTGASTGIGFELARVLAREGHDLIITARDANRLATAAAALQAQYAVAVDTIAADLADPAGPDAVMQDVARRGRSIDVLVNNAGVGVYGLFADTPLDRELRMVQLNVSSLVALTKRCLPSMRERRHGRILNIASTAGFLPGPRMAVYYATKAFVISFSEAIAEELRDTGITVSVLCPGPTESRFKETAGSQRSRLFNGVLMQALPVAEAGYRGMMQGQRVIVPGAQNRAVPLLARVLPRRVMTVLSRRAAELA